MYYAIHGVVHAYPHCVGFERDRSTQNEWLHTTREKGGKRSEFKARGPIWVASQRVKGSQDISNVEKDKEMGIFLPWKKLVFPDPLAPTAKVSKQKLLFLPTNTRTTHSFDLNRKDKKWYLKQLYIKKGRIVKTTKT